MGAQDLQQVDGPVQALAQRHHADEAEPEPATRQAGTVQVRHGHGVGDHRDPRGLDGQVLAHQVPVEIGDGHEAVHGVGLERGEPAAAQLEHVQADHESLAGALVAGVPDGVGARPLAHHDVGPLDEAA